MIRRLLVLGSAAALGVSSLIAIQPAHSAARGAVCQVSGSATISPGLTTKAQNESVSINGVKLTGCRVGSTASPGLPTKAVTGNVTVTPNPAATKGACQKGGLTGLTATIAWSTGTSTTTSFSTTSVTGETVIQGTVTSSTDPNLKPGDLVKGDVLFRPTTTAQNCVTVPVTAVTFTGALGAGSPK